MSTAYTLSGLDRREIDIAIGLMLTGGYSFVCAPATMDERGWVIHVDGDAAVDVLREAFRLPTWDEWLDLVTSVRYSPPLNIWVNGHELRETNVDVDPNEPCWRIAYLAERAAKVGTEGYPATVEDWPTNSDFPNGVIHDETCPTCKGSGINAPVLREKRTAYLTCVTCETQLPSIDDFKTTSCLIPHGITKGIIDEWRAEHENGEHAHHEPRPGCPLCCEEVMRAKAEARKNPAPALG